MDINQLQAMIAQITDDVITSGAGGVITPDAEHTRPDTLVFITSAIASPQKTFALIREEYGDDVEYIIFDDELEYGGIRAIHSTGGCQGLIEKVAAAEHIVLLAPRISTLTNVSKGADVSTVEQLFLKALLWGIDTCAWLDFKPMKFKRNTFFERVLNAVDALVDMGVGIHTYDCLPDSRPKALPTLVTERDVLDAAEQGKHDLFCASEAVITPAAADRASILNIRIFRR